MVIVASGVAAGLLQHNIDVLSLTRKISGGIPSFKVPDFSINSHNVTMSGTQIMSVGTQKNCSRPLVDWIGILDF